MSSRLILEHNRTPDAIPFCFSSQVTITTSVLFCGCSIGTALAPNLAAFFVFRILTAFEGTAFILIGSACLRFVVTRFPASAGCEML